MKNCNRYIKSLIIGVFVFMVQAFVAYSPIFTDSVSILLIVILFFLGLYFIYPYLFCLQQNSNRRPPPYMK